MAEYLLPSGPELDEEGVGAQYLLVDETVVDEPAPVTNNRPFIILRV